MNLVPDRGVCDTSWSWGIFYLTFLSRGDSRGPDSGGNCFCSWKKWTVLGLQVSETAAVLRALKS